MVEYMRERQPASWALLKLAAAQGLVVIDEATDSITATNRLLLTYTGLHEVVSMLVDSWAERSYDSRSAFSELLKPGSATTTSATAKSTRQKASHDNLHAQT
jgi:hypothetical protein